MINFGSAINWVANSIPVTAIQNFAATVKGYTLDTFGAPAADLNINAKKLTNVASGAVSTDAVNKGQMDTAISNAVTGLGTGTVKKYAATITGDGTKTSFAVSHGLNNADTQVYVRDGSDGSLFLVDAVSSDANTVTLNFSSAPANAKTYRVTVQG